MPKRVHYVVLSEEQHEQLRAIAFSKTHQLRQIVIACALLKTAAGQSDADVAEALISVVRLWARFAAISVRRESKHASIGANRRAGSARSQEMSKHVSSRSLAAGLLKGAPVGHCAC